MEDDVISTPEIESTVTAPVVESTPAPEVTTEQAKAPDSTSTPIATESRRDTIAKALSKPTNRGKHAAYQPREAGKFAPGSPQIPAASAPVVPVTAAPVAPEYPLPKSLKKDYEQHWNQTPAELRAALIQREADYEKGITTYRTQAQEAAAVLDQFKPYEWILRNEGATPQTAIAPLLQTAAILRTGTPAQKAQSVAQVMQQFGIPIEHIQQLMSGQQASQGAADPQYSQLAQQVQQLTQHFTQSQQAQQQQFQQRALSVIQQFSTDPKNAHFAAVQDKMIGLLQAPEVLGITDAMSEREKLQLAYDAAIRLDPTISAQALAQQQADAAAKQRAQAQAAANVAKTAAVQITGAPGSPLPDSVNPNNRREVIANALRAVTH